MVTVLPVSRRGDDEGCWVLESLISHHKDNVIAIIEIGEFDTDYTLIPPTLATFIVLMVDTGFTFTAFVVDRVKLLPEVGDIPPKRSFSEAFQDFVRNFMKEVDNKGIDKRGFLAEHRQVQWDRFFEAISGDFGYTDENISELIQAFNKESPGAWTTNKTMETYRRFLLDFVFNSLLLYIIPAPSGGYIDAIQDF